MIISTNSNALHVHFEKLLNLSINDLKDKAQGVNSNYFLNQTGVKLENDVFDSLKEQAVGTEFDGSIEKISGQRFPDIVVKKYYGVEVKSTSQNHWSTTGNSVLESTRVENIERIYLYFGKLVNPIDFRWRRYEECLKDVVVTHSPRYLIDMELKPKDTIFNKIGIPYATLRKDSNPIKPIIKYYRSLLKPGEDLWWLDSGENIGKEAEEPATTINLRLWSNLTKTEKETYYNQIMALFPQIFGNSNSKYISVASWLIVRRGVLISNLRDIFSAGGQKPLPDPYSYLGKFPRVFTNLYNNFEGVVHQLNKFSEDELITYWKKSRISDDRVLQWIQLVTENAETLLIKSEVIRRVLLALKEK